MFAQWQCTVRTLLHWLCKFLCMIIIAFLLRICTTNEKKISFFLSYGVLELKKTKNKKQPKKPTVKRFSNSVIMISAIFLLFYTCFLIKVPDMLKESNRSYNTCLVLKTNQQTKYLNTGKSVMGFGNWRFFYYYCCYLYMHS